MKLLSRHYVYLMPVIAFILPTLIPVFLWGETWSNSWNVATILRYVWLLNMTWLVNSAAHTWGNQPYDKYVLFFLPYHPHHLEGLSLTIPQKEILAHS